MDYTKLDGVNGHFMNEGVLMLPESDRMCQNDWNELYDRLLDMVSSQLKQIKNRTPELDSQVWNKMKEIYQATERLRKDWPGVTKTLMNEAMKQWTEEL